MDIEVSFNDLYFLLTAKDMIKSSEHINMMAGRMRFVEIWGCVIFTQVYFNNN